MTPHFVVIGHVVKDVSDDSWRPGGTVIYAAAQASKLGLSVGVVTCSAGDVDTSIWLPGTAVCLHSSDKTTSFENRYEGGKRVQHVWAQARPIEAKDIPVSWREARVVLLGPVIGEMGPELGALFGDSLVGFCAQGWLREVAPDGLVVPKRWDGRLSLRGVDVVIASDDDLGDDRNALEAWQGATGVVVVTSGMGGARVYNDGRWRTISAFPHREVDPTGAGDVFATAFVIALDETRSVERAARFAGAAAGLSVEGEGTSKIAGRDGIERVSAEHPEVVLK